MARNKKEVKQTVLVAARLDKETKKLWDNANKSQNMSEWVRVQILYHFGRHRSVEHERGKMLEEVRVLNEQYMALQAKFEGEMAWRIKRYKELEPQEVSEVPNILRKS